MKVGRKQDFDVANADDKCRDRFVNWNQDMWWILVDKTIGAALLRVKGVDQCQGMEARRRFHQWYGKQTYIGLAELRLRVIRPAQAKREEDIARCIEEWNEAHVELKRYANCHQNRMEAVADTIQMIDKSKAC